MLINDFISKINNIYLELQEFDKKIILAVSGGVDSMVLLYVFLELAKKYNIIFEVIHIDHAQRLSSALVAKELGNFVKKLGIDYTSFRLNIQKNASEQELRDARYNCFLQYAKLDDVVILAHHKNDNFENFWLGLLRSSFYGLSGMVKKRAHATINIYRPLISWDRKYIEEIFIASGYPLWEDESNYDTKFLRNKIRQGLIKDLENDYPTLMDNVIVFQERLKNMQLWAEKAINIALIEASSSYWLIHEKIKVYNQSQIQDLIYHWCKKSDIIPTGAIIKLIYKHLFLSHALDKIDNLLIITSYSFTTIINYDLYNQNKTLLHPLGDFILEENYILKYKMPMMTRIYGKNKNLKSEAQELKIPKWFRDIWPVVFKDDKCLGWFIVNNNIKLQPTEIGKIILDYCALQKINVDKL